MDLVVDDPYLLRNILERLSDAPENRYGLESSTIKAASVSRRWRELCKEIAKSRTGSANFGLLIESNMFACGFLYEIGALETGAFSAEWSVQSPTLKVDVLRGSRRLRSFLAYHFVVPFDAVTLDGAYAGDPQLFRRILTSEWPFLSNEDLCELSVLYGQERADIALFATLLQERGRDDYFEMMFCQVLARELFDKWPPNKLALLLSQPGTVEAIYRLAPARVYRLMTDYVAQGGSSLLDSMICRLHRAVPRFTPRKWFCFPREREARRWADVPKFEVEAILYLLGAKPGAPPRSGEPAAAPLSKRARRCMLTDVGWLVAWAQANQTTTEPGDALRIMGLLIETEASVETIVTVGKALSPP